MIRKRFNNIGFFLVVPLLWWLVALDGWAMLVTEEKFEEMCKDDAQGAQQLQTLFEDHEEEEIQEWLNTPFDNNGYTPLHFSTRQACKEIVQLLLSRGADPKITNRYGSMPLHAAAFNGNVEIARLLLEHQADPMALFSNDWTPLHVAATNGQVGVARLLLEHQANPMAETGGGNTPLHEAAGNGHLQVAMLLFQEYQANFMAQNAVGETPLSLATTNGHAAIVGLFSGMSGSLNTGATSLGLMAVSLSLQNSRSSSPQ